MFSLVILTHIRNKMNKNKSIKFEGGYLYTANVYNWPKLGEVIPLVSSLLRKLKKLFSTTTLKAVLFNQTPLG